MSTYMNYRFKEIEKKWRIFWETHEIYKTQEQTDKESKYILDMFPYPSGAGLHVGHPKGYIATDVLSRMYMMQGYNVLHPMGFDAFGLPAENYAIKHKIHPRVAVEQNIENFKQQLSSIGFSYDWSREINTTDPSYYKWTQWIFLQLYKAGLAYEAQLPINWCPSCKTGLANEEVVDGKCERCSTEVTKKQLRQWVLKITQYAHRLLEDLDELDWPQSIKLMQKNWIGKSEGAHIFFPVDTTQKRITVFTTRPDTLYGATYLVLSPEHELIEEITRDAYKKTVEHYVQEAQKKSDLERTQLQKEKTGVFTGSYATHPLTGDKLAIWVADYVLGHYGHGAIMAVPAHDERDFAFAQTYELPMIQVVAPALEYYKSYVMGLEFSDEDIKTLGITIHEITEDKAYKITIPKQKLHEYFSFIRKHLKPGFWNEVVGEAIFFIFKFEDESIKEFPLNKETAQEIDELAATFQKESHTSWQYPWKWLANNDWYTDMILCTQDGFSIHSQVINGLSTQEAKNTMTQYLEEKGMGKKAIQYKLRDWLFSRQRYWGEPIPIIHCDTCGIVGVPEKDLPVILPDVKQYEPTGTGESPLAAISDWVNTTCPQCGGKGKRETNTMPQWAGSCWYYLRYIDSQNNEVLADYEKLKQFLPVHMYVGGAEHAVLHLLYARFWHKFLYDIKVVPTKEPFYALRNVGLVLAQDGRKMSKSLGNVISPDDIITRYGADSFRTYEMFMGPFEQTIKWSTDSVTGVYRFLQRVYKNVTSIENEEESQELQSLLEKTIKKVTRDITVLSYNTAISAMMIYMNNVEEEGAFKKENKLRFVQLLAPFAPHLAEELWEILGENPSIFHSTWPQYNEQKMQYTTITYVCMVNGKVRDNIKTQKGLTQEQVEVLAGELESVKKHVAGKDVKKIIFVQDKLINFVV